jgi:hypothetical protein
MFSTTSAPSVQNIYKQKLGIKIWYACDWWLSDKDLTDRYDIGI